MYLDRSKMLSFFFFSLSCGRNRAREAGSAAGPRAASPAGLLARSPPSCRAAPLCAGAAAAPFDLDPHACAAHVRRLRGTALRDGALLGNVWRRLRRGPADMAAAAALARLAAAFLLLMVQVRAMPAPPAPPDAVTRPLGHRRAQNPRPARPRGSLGDPRPSRGQPASPEPRRDLAGLSPALLPSPSRRPFPVAASLISARP